jgi:hypothetical protein
VLRAGDVRRPHYAHASVAPCAGETALHRATIEILATEIESASRSRRALLAADGCRDCDQVTMRNLARRHDLRAARERPLSHAGQTARPDILILDPRSGRPVYVVEVVVSHEPDAGARSIFDALGLPMVIVRPSWDAISRLELPRESVDALGDVVIEGARCASWRHPPRRGARCDGCDREGTVCTVQRWTGSACWRCGELVPYIDLRIHDEHAIDDVDGWSGQPFATARTIGPAILPLASALGALLDQRWTYHSGKIEVVHLCSGCGATQGRPARGGRDASAPEATAPVSWCPRCRRIEALGAPRARPTSGENEALRA